MDYKFMMFYPIYRNILLSLPKDLPIIEFEDVPRLKEYLKSVQTPNYSIDALFDNVELSREYAYVEFDSYMEGLVNEKFNWNY